MREQRTDVSDDLLRLAMNVGEFRSMRMAVDAMRHLDQPMTFVASPYHPDLIEDGGRAFIEQARRLGHRFRSDVRANPGLIYLRPFDEPPGKGLARVRRAVRAGRAGVTPDAGG